jgi:hypothetical protein
VIRESTDMVERDRRPRAAFTPGPWSLEPNWDENSPPSIIVSTQDEVIAEVYAELVASEPRCVADANLIAAAPGLYDMLEIAARTIEIIIETLEEHGHRKPPSAVDVVQSARQILAKARGDA